MNTYSMNDVSKACMYHADIAINICANLFTDDNFLPGSKAPHDRRQVTTYRLEKVSNKYFPVDLTGTFNIKTDD